MSDDSPDGVASGDETDCAATRGNRRITDRLGIQELSAVVSDAAIAVLDGEGQFTAWNDGAQALFGYGAETVVGSRYRRLFPAAEREAGDPERLLEAARSSGTVESEGWRVASDGDRVWVRETVATVDGGDVGVAVGAATEPAGYVWVVHDRTDDHERERRLREEKHVAERVVEAQPDVVYAFDTEGTFIEWSDRVPAVTGYTESELLEMDPLEFVAPADRDRVEAAIDRVLERETCVTTEAALLTKDGRRIPYEFNSARVTDDDDGTVLGFTGIGRDVSDRKARERELREEKAFTESVLEAQPDILYAFDTEGNLIEWNDQFRRMTGYGEGELTGMHPLRFIAPDDRDHIGAAIDRILEAGERVTAEGRVLTRDGERIPYEFNSARITDDNGTVLGFTGVGRDISDRKARERELERLERLNAIIRTIDETIVAAETRDEIERAIVEAFAAADAYRFAVIGRADPDGTDGYAWTPETGTGIDPTANADLLSSFVDSPAEADGSPALESRSVQRYRALPESDIEAWRTHAAAREYASVAVVPIVANDRPFGALVIAAREPSAFDDREREVLQEFGGTIGHAINAMAVRRLLYLDTVVELELESTDRGDVCIELSWAAGCDLLIDHVLPLTDEVFVYYLTVSGVDPDTLRSAATEATAITELRLIDADDDESYWEVVVQGSTITELLGEYGARLESKVVREGTAELTVQASPDSDLRELVGAITSAYPDTRLVSKRTVDRPVQTRGDFRRAVESALTEKQRLALEAAYHGGYFEWPTRNSDASKIADRLDIARQTFHQHLRVAQAKLLSAYFGDDE